MMRNYSFKVKPNKKVEFKKPKLKLNSLIEGNEVYIGANGLFKIAGYREHGAGIVCEAFPDYARHIKINNHPLFGNPAFLNRKGVVYFFSEKLASYKGGILAIDRVYEEYVDKAGKDYANETALVIFEQLKGIALKSTVPQYLINYESFVEHLNKKYV